MPRQERRVVGCQRRCLDHCCAPRDRRYALNELKNMCTCVFQIFKSNNSTQNTFFRMSFVPTSNFTTPLLTDKYQLSMAYAYFKNNTHMSHAVFDLYFRKNPFEGEFTIFGGLEECLRFVANFRFSESDVAFVRSLFPHADERFMHWLRHIDCRDVKLFACDEGTIVFPNLPLIRIEGPLAVCQLLETTLLVLVNFASLMATNAARHCIAAGPNSSIIEFGLRRAQGTDGAMSATRYAFLGGAVGTSNVLGGRMFGIPISGTHAHAFVTSFVDESDLHERQIVVDGKPVDLFALATNCLRDLKFPHSTNKSELVAFVSFAVAFPDSFLALVDTYNTLASGVPNFLAVALALQRCGHRALGIRLDSGDLASLSKRARQLFRDASSAVVDFDVSQFQIVASNGINESILLELREQKHEIDVFGVGTNLVTCEAQPALGCVYKLVEIHNRPRVKVSEESSKSTLPARKHAARLYDESKKPIGDVLLLATENVLCSTNAVLDSETRSRSYELKPQSIEPLHKLYWLGKQTEASAEELQSAQSEFKEDTIETRSSPIRSIEVNDHQQHDIGLVTTQSGQVTRSMRSLYKLRKRVLLQLAAFDSSHWRSTNASRYRQYLSPLLVSVANQLFAENK